MNPANTTVRIASIAIALCLLSAACSSGGTDASTDSTETPTSQQTADETATTTADEPITTTTAEQVAKEQEPESAMGPGCGSLEPGVTSLTMTSGGADHRVRIFVPSDPSDEPLPVVVNWHGLGSTGEQQAIYSGYEVEAETGGFIVVHPTGVPAPGDGRNSWELVDTQDPTRDDMAFAADLFDMLVADWCADQERIFSTGMSNGGFFTARLVCEMPERLAGAISVAGVFHPPGCEPAEEVPFLAFHGTADAVVPFDGDGQSVLAEPGDSTTSEFFSQVMPEEFAEFAADAECGAPVITEVSAEVVRYDYPDCGVPMAFFEIVDGGHTWPGSPIAAATAALGFTTDDVSATVDGWAFFDSLDRD